VAFHHNYVIGLCGNRPFYMLTFRAGYISRIKIVLNVLLRLHGDCTKSGTLKNVVNVDSISSVTKIIVCNSIFDCCVCVCVCVCLEIGGGAPVDVCVGYLITSLCNWPWP